MVFRLMEEEFAAEVRSVREIIPLTKVSALPQCSQLIEGVISLRKHVIAVVDLRKRFGLQRSERMENARVIIVKARRMILGLIVDAVSEVQTFTRDLVHPAPAIVTTQIDHRYISGIVRWKDRIITLLDLEEIFTPSEEEYLRNMKSAGGSVELSNSKPGRSTPSP